MPKRFLFNKKIAYFFDRIDSILPYSNFRQPIFIIAPPRSGSSLLFNCLSEFDQLYHLPREADYIWWRIFPYDKMEKPSDYVDCRHISPDALQALRRHTYKEAILNYIKKMNIRSKLPYAFGFKPIRYLDKTIANCFHLDFLKCAFPRAKYVFLVRDPRSNISSMMEGWPHIKRFGKPQLSLFFSASGNLKVSHWSYPAPPGWRSHLTKPLPQICAWSWKQHVEYALRFLSQNQKDMTIVRYEELISNSEKVISALATKLNLKMSKKVRDYCRNPPLSWTTVTDPCRDKWKKMHYESILSILPEIKDAASQIGYDVSIN